MGTGERKAECTSMQGQKNGAGREKNERKKASFDIQWSLGSGHPQVYLAQSGSSMIIEQTSQQTPASRPPHGKIYIPIFM